MRSFLVLALVVGASSLLPAAESTPNNLPTLDVVVEDGRGKAVETLGPSDFSVTEQSRALAVESVRLVSAKPGSGGVAAVPVSQAAPVSTTDAGRLIAIYLDEFHVTPGPAAERVRASLIRVLSENGDPSDRVIVLKSLDSLLEISPAQDLRDAIQKLESFDPRRGDYQPRTSFERNFIAGTPARVEIARAQIATSSLEALATELGRLSAARKTLIVVSEGFAKNIRRRGDEMLPSLESVVLAANQAHVSIYPFDPAPDDQGAITSDGATAVPSDPTRWRETLRSLADGTSGRTISEAGDVESELKRAISDSRAYYELTLAKDVTRDGRFHAVEVSVRRPGLTVRARKGYWAPSDREPLSRAALASASALPVGARIARRTSPLIRPWFGISRTADGQTEISFVWEPAPRVPGDRNPPPPLAQIGLSVMTLEGAPVYKGIVLPSTAQSDPGVSQSRASFVSPSGRLVVQMAIEDVTSRVVDRDVRDLVVKGFPGPVSMGSPEVMRARTAREYQALAADPDATPVASRQFSRTERLLIRIPVFSTGGAPTVGARLVTSFGSTMRDLVVTPTPSRANEYQVDVPLAALAIGSYAVEWTARTAEGDVRDRVAFRVTP
jgi:VWFA-related protein